MNITPQIKNALGFLGLSEKEVNIYLTLLQQKEAITVTKLSRKLPYNRPTLYFHIDSLIKKQAVRELPGSKVKRLVAVQPEKLSDLMHQKTLKFTEVMKDVERLSNLDATHPQIQIRQLRDSHFDFYFELANLPKGSMFRVIQSKASGIRDLSSTRPQEWEKIYKSMIKNDIRTKAIFTEDLIGSAKTEMKPELFKLFKKRTWHLKSVPEEIHDLEEMFIFQNTVAFLLTDIGMIISIEHERIAGALTGVFDALWAGADRADWER